MSVSILTDGGRLITNGCSSEATLCEHLGVVFGRASDRNAFERHRRVAEVVDVAASNGPIENTY